MVFTRNHLICLANNKLVLCPATKQNLCSSSSHYLEFIEIYRFFFTSSNLFEKLTNFVSLITITFQSTKMSVQIAELRDTSLRPYVVGGILPNSSAAA